MDKIYYLLVFLLGLLISTLLVWGYTQISTSVAINLTASTNNVRFNETLNNASQSSWNETFTTSENKTFYVTIPQNSSVIDAKLSLSGYNVSFGDTNFIDTSAPNCRPLNSETGIGGLHNSTTFFCSVGGVSQYNKYTVNSTGSVISASPTVFDCAALDMTFNSSLSLILTCGDYLMVNGTNRRINITEFSSSGITYNDTHIFVGQGKNLIVLNWTKAEIDGYCNSTNTCLLENNSIGINAEGGISDLASDGTYIYYTAPWGWPAEKCEMGKTFRNGTIIKRINMTASTESWCSIYYNDYGGLYYVDQNTNLYVVFPSDLNITNPYLDVSGDGDTEWSFSGEFNQTNNQTSNFSSEINTYLSTCSADSNCNCNLSMILHSDTAGKIQISAINVTFNYNTSILYNISYQSEVTGYFINHTSKNASVNISTVGYYTNSTDNYCEIDSIRYTPTSGYCPLSEIHNRSNKWTNHSIWFNTLDKTAPAISSITYQPSCVQKDTINMIWSFEQMDNRNTSNNDLTQSYCNFTSPASLKYQINSSNTNDNANVTCQKSFNETGTWYIRVVAVDLNSNTGQSSLYAFDVQSSCGSGEPSGGGGGGGGAVIEVPVEVPAEPCVEGWIFDTKTQACIPEKPFVSDIEKKLVNPLFPNASYPLNLIAPFHILLSLFVLIPTFAKGKVARWKK